MKMNIEKTKKQPVNIVLTTYEHPGIGLEIKRVDDKLPACSPGSSQIVQKLFPWFPENYEVVGVFRKT